MGWCPDKKGAAARRFLIKKERPLSFSLQKNRGNQTGRETETRKSYVTVSETRMDASHTLPAEFAPPTPRDDGLAEVNTLDDIAVKEYFDLGPDDVPPPDDDESIADDASVADMEDVEEEGGPSAAAPPPILEEAAEDHSAYSLKTHTAAVFSVAVNAAHPEAFATGGGDDVGYLWTLGDPTPRARLDGHTETVSALSFSADGTLLASAGLDGVVRVWDATTGTPFCHMSDPTLPISHTFNCYDRSECSDTRGNVSGGQLDLLAPARERAACGLGGRDGVDVEAPGGHRHANLLRPFRFCFLWHFCE